MTREINSLYGAKKVDLSEIGTTRETNHLLRISRTFRIEFVVKETLRRKGLVFILYQ